jgi:hypothetical protein
MPFTKETAKIEGAKGAPVRVKKKQELFDFIASGGAREYHKLLEQQLGGEKLNKEQEKAMDRVERLFPYVKAKLQSVEQKTELSGELNISGFTYETPNQTNT